MATKKEMVKELIQLGSEESETSLMREKSENLEIMLNDIKNSQKEEVKPSMQPFDFESLKEQMMKELKAEMEEKLRAELKSEMESKAKVSSVDLAKEPTVTTSTTVEPFNINNVDKSKLVPVMNITAHNLVYISKRTGGEWNWGKYGDIEYLDIQELITMRNAHRRFINDPFVLIMDDEAVKFLGLEKMYQDMISPDDIDKVFKMSVDKFEEVVEKAPQGIRILIVNRAKQLVDSGKLDSMKIISSINKFFGTELGK